MNGEGALDTRRVIDTTVAAVGLVMLSPLLLVIAWRVRQDLGSPVLFRQVRPGLHGAPFTMYKFRTMRDDRGPDGELLADADRLTPFGQWLRSTSLDELPELVNVVRGEMALVGPRPLLMEYLERYSPEQARRHEVRPGITGWSQVHGRNDRPWPEKLANDVWYVDHRNAWLDMRIVARTVLVVLTRRGIASRGHATTPLFGGEGPSTDADAPPGSP